MTIKRSFYGRIGLFVAVFGALFAFLPSSSDASENENNARAQITDLIVAGDEKAVRVVFDISEVGDLSSFVLSAPYRLVIDFHDSDFKLRQSRAQGDPGFLKTVRFGKGPDGDARVIFTSEKPLELAQSFSLPQTADKPARLVFDLEETSEIDFRLAIARAATTKSLHLRGEGERFLPANKAPSSAFAKRGETRKSDQIKKTGQRKIPHIVIDPGHGGRDGGASAVGNPDILEKHLVLKFGQDLAQALKARADVEIKLTREDDRKVSLARRVEIAREFDADLFVSIHADSFPQDRSVRGATVYTLSDKASGEVAAIIAEQENKADFIAGYAFNEAPEEVVDILLDLTRRETQELSVNFARYVISKLKTKIRFFKRPHQTGAFRVLKAPEIPSALIELGYLSNSKDVARISSKKWRRDIADNLAKVIMDYLESVEALEIPLTSTQ